MKTLTLALCSLLFFLSFSTHCFALLPEIYMQIGAGYRNDAARWKEKDFAGRFKIKEADIIKLNGGVETTILSFLLKAEADYGLALDGRSSFRNFDYDTNGTFIQTDCLDGNYVYDYSLSLGMDVSFFLPCIKILPLLGYSYHFQKYALDVDEDPYLVVQQAKHYQARWQGPWVGLGLNLDFWRCINTLSLSVEYQYHLVNFQGKLDLDSYFYDESFHQSSYGSGNVAKARVRWIFCHGWAVSLGGLYQYWSAKKARWDSYEINLNVGYVF